jgi:hypothetical protein
MCCARANRALLQPWSPNSYQPRKKLAGSNDVIRCALRGFVSGIVLHVFLQAGKVLGGDKHIA